MAEIYHRVGIKASAKSIYQALIANESLSSWWANGISNTGDVDSAIEP